MASHGQTHDDYAGVYPMHNDNALELFPFNYDGTDVSTHFPFLHPQTFPSPAENVCGYQQSFPSGAIHDLDMVTNVDEHNRFSLNNPVGQDVVVRNNIPMQNNQSFSFPSVAVGTNSSGFPTSNNMMSSYQGMNRVPHFENNHASVLRSSISANSSGLGNLQMSALVSAPQNRTEIGRTFTNFASEPKFAQSILPRVYSNQVRVHSSQPNSEDKLDGRFLSLGYQGEAASYMNSYGGKASHHIGDSSYSSVFNSSFNNVRGGLAAFENNVRRSVTPLGCGDNQTLSGGDYYGLQTMSSGFDTSPIINLDEGQVNMHHYIPTPSIVYSESGIKPNTIIDLTDSSECSGANSYMFSNVSQYDDGSLQPKKRRMQRAPFNSSVLRNNNQIAAEPHQNSHLSTNLSLPPLGTNIGESDSHDKSGVALGFVSGSSGVQTTEGDHLHRSNRLLPAGQIYPPFPVLGWPSAGQGADITVNNERSCGSSAVKSESLKRIIDSPPRAAAQHQRNKLKSQTSVQHFSPHLLQNALGQIAIGHSAPVTTSVKESNIPSGLKDLSASGWPRSTKSWLSAEGSTGTSNTVRLQQNPIALTAAFVSPIHIPPTCTAEDSPACLADSSAIPVVSVDSPMASLPMNAPSVALARTMASLSGSSRIPIPATSTKKVMIANIPAAANRIPSAIAPRRSNLLHSVHTSSTINRPVRTAWKKSLPTMAGLAKIDPALRATQVLNSMSHIKWQGFDIPPTTGFKCMICNRDLSFTPDGPVMQPPIPPAVAVLPCGHTFHDQCLLRIMPEDQLKDPPCIPCVVDN